MSDLSANNQKLFTKLTMATIFVILTPILFIVSIAYDFIGVAVAIIVIFNIAVIVSYLMAWKSQKLFRK